MPFPFCRRVRPALLAAMLGCLWSPVLAGAVQAEPRYVWLSAPQSAARPVAPDADTLAARFPPPAGFERVPAAAGSWAEWLRGLPLKVKGAPVRIYTGAPKWRQDVHAAVVDIDVGTRDLQQCADAIMRLRGEWLYGSGRGKEVAFNNTDGSRRAFSRARGSDYAAFRKYMDLVFAYAGTYSLERELKPVAVADIAIGDVFIKGGFPGHAVLVVDLAENTATGERRFLLLQSYMPAQEMHILRNPNAGDGSAWYSSEIGDELVTPEWVFKRTALRRWPG